MPDVSIEISTIEGRQRLDDLLATMARLVIYRIDLARRVVIVSDRLAQLIGWTEGAPPRALDELLALVHADDRVRLEERLAHTVATQESFDTEIRVTAHLGERWLHVIGHLVAGGGYIVGTGMDVTARKQADAALRSSEAKVNILLDAAIDALVMVGADGLVSWVNRTALTMFRCDAGRIVGAPWQRFLDLRGGALPAGALYDGTGLRADGTTFPIEGGFNEVVLDGATMTLCAVRDVSERRALERQVLDLGEQLQRQIGQDLHDGLGQLLTGTAFLAKDLQRSVAAEYQPQAVRVVELINQAIANVRSLARGLSPVHVESRSLGAMLNQVVTESATLLGVDCVLHVAEQPQPHGSTTIVHLCLIAREAINNAVRHGHARRIVVRLAREGPSTVLSIVDDGIGIERSERPYEGLGLRSMRQRAKMIGGTLEVARGEVGTIVRCCWSDSP